MDEAESKEDVQSILTYGAKELFEAEGDQAAKDIHCEYMSLSWTVVKTYNAFLQIQSMTLTNSSRGQKQRAINQSST